MIAPTIQNQGTVSTSGGYSGTPWLYTSGSSYNVVDFLIRQVIAGKAFHGLVKVLSVTGGGVTGQPATVSVQPTVNQIDGFGNQTPHGQVYNIPCFRLQGGSSAVVVDPAVGDIGMAVCCDRDISNVKTNGDISGPGSFRQHDWADGCYFGSFLGGAPTTYVWTNDGTVTVTGPTAVNIVSATAVNVTTPLMTLAGNLQVNGNINATGTISP